MISSTLCFLLVQLNYHFPYSLFKSDWFAGENYPFTCTGYKTRNVTVARCGEMPLGPTLHLPSVRDLLALVMSFSLLSLYLTYHLGFSAGRLHTVDGNRQEALAYRDIHVESPFRSPQLLDLLFKVSDRLP